MYAFAASPDNLPVEELAGIAIPSDSAVLNPNGVDVCAAQNRPKSIPSPYSFIVEYAVLAVPISWSASVAKVFSAK